MKNFTLLISASLLLAACAAIPETHLENPVTGERIVCGGDESSGNVVADAISHNIKRTDAKECVEEYKKIGFKVMPPGLY